jgi:outer membrane protein TolC
MVMTVMPGFMQMLPGPGKLKARANMAAAGSQTKYFAFETAVLQSAFDLKKSFYELHFLDERLRVSRENLGLLGQLESIGRAQNEVGKGTLQDVLRAQIERDRLAAEIANLEDSRHSRFAMFKAALGLNHNRPDPPIPTKLDENVVYPDPDALLRIAFARNPRLKAMEAEVRAMQASIAMAYKERIPDFYLGLMADAKASPTMFRPLAGATLPIWRDKLAAQVAQAKANELAAESRLSAEQIMLTVQVAEKAFAYREINRNLALVRDQLIPKAQQSLELARAGYLSGTIDFFNLIDSERMLLEFRTSEVESRMQREIVLAELSLLVAGVPPPGAPLLDPTRNISSAPSQHSNKN